MATTCRSCGASVEELNYCSACQRPLDADPERWVSQTVGNYEILECVGEGPIGMVFAATYVPSGQKVRLKLVDSELIAIDADLMEAVNSLVIGSTGLHDSLPELVELGLENPDARLVSTQWVEGQTLQDRLDQGPMAEVEAALVVGAVLKAVDALHVAGFTHRDIKPQNVLVAPEGSAPTAYLLDVGPSLISATARTQAFYRSPEQARGGERAGRATDIYGCGALLYRVLSGRPPFESGDYDVLMSQISLRRPAALEQLCPDVDPALIQIVVKAMEPTTGDRYRSAVDMLRALRGWVAEQERPSVPEQRLSIPQHDLPQVPVAGGHGVPLAPPVEGEAGEGAVGAGTPSVPPLDQLSANAQAQRQPAPPMPPPQPVVQHDLPPPPVRDSQPAASDMPFEVGAQAPTPDMGSDADREEILQSAGGGKKAAAVVFSIIALGIGGAFLYFTVMAGQERDDLTGIDQNVTPAQEVLKTRPNAVGGTVRIKLSGLPDGAAWYVDGRRLGSNPFRAPRSPAVHKIRVEAPGHETFNADVSFGSDQEVVVQMTAVEADTPTPSGFKAFTHGRGANQRPRKVKNRLNPFREEAVDKAPTKLRDRGVTAPR